MKFATPLVLGAALMLGAAGGAMAQTYLAGSYDGADHKGMSLLAFDAKTDVLASVRAFPTAPNASFALYDAKTRRLYVTDEGEGIGRVGVHRLSPDGKTLESLGYQSSEAPAPCYLALSPDRTRLAVANYGGDLVTVFALDPATGALLPNPQQVHGAHDAKAGHAHWVQWSPEGDSLYVVDLGHDEVRVHPYDAKIGVVGAARTAASLPKGAGPRHLAFHPKARFAYAVTEYANTVTAFRREADGSLTALQTLPTVPAGTKSFAAHVSIDAAGRTLYMSNRGHNSIASFRIGDDGRLTPLQTVSTGGDWPRFFLLHEGKKRLFVAHQRSNDIVGFKVGADGKLTPTGKTLALPRAVLMVPVN